MISKSSHTDFLRLLAEINAEASVIYLMAEGSVAGIDCQKCHGPVEEMEILYQYSPLTMGWCINCHRDSNIKVKDNEYYTKIHEELSKKYGVEELSIAQMGGLECGKCHY